MTTQVALKEIFDVAEELVGTYPSADALRSAIHAIITKSMDIDANVGGMYRKVGSTVIMNNVEYIARQYEYERGTHMHLNVTIYSDSRNADEKKRGLCTAECNQP